MVGPSQAVLGATDGLLIHLWLVQRQNLLNCRTLCSSSVMMMQWSEWNRVPVCRRTERPLRSGAAWKWIPEESRPAHTLNCSLQRETIAHFIFITGKTCRKTQALSHKSLDSTADGSDWWYYKWTFGVLFFFSPTWSCQDEDRVTEVKPAEACRLYETICVTICFPRLTIERFRLSVHTHTHTHAEQWPWDPGSEYTVKHALSDPLLLSSCAFITYFCTDSTLKTKNSLLLWLWFPLPACGWIFTWRSQDEFIKVTHSFKLSHTDQRTPRSALDTSSFKSPRWWKLSPQCVVRRYDKPAGDVTAYLWYRLWFCWRYVPVTGNWTSSFPLSPCGTPWDSCFCWLVLYKIWWIKSTYIPKPKLTQSALFLLYIPTWLLLILLHGCIIFIYFCAAFLASCVNKTTSKLNLRVKMCVWEQNKGLFEYWSLRSDNRVGVDIRRIRSELQIKFFNFHLKCTQSALAYITRFMWWRAGVCDVMSWTLSELPLKTAWRFVVALITAISHFSENTASHEAH